VTGEWSAPIPIMREAATWWERCCWPAFAESSILIFIVRRTVLLGAHTGDGPAGVVQCWSFALWCACTRMQRYAIGGMTFVILV
jgi:hypothetical protein